MTQNALRMLNGIHQNEAGCCWLLQRDTDSWNVSRVPAGFGASSRDFLSEKLLSSRMFHFFLSHTPSQPVNELIAFKFLTWDCSKTCIPKPTSSDCDIPAHWYPETVLRCSVNANERVLASLHQLSTKYWCTTTIFLSSELNAEHPILKITDRIYGKPSMTVDGRSSDESWPEQCFYLHTFW